MSRENQKKEKGIMETIREVNRKERQEQIRRESDRVKEAARAKEQTDEEYRQQLQREKIELMKSKQGITESAEPVNEEDEKKNYTVWQKISTFWYCNRAMVIIFSFFIILAGFLVSDIIRKPRPDLTLAVFAYDPELEQCLDAFRDITEEYIPDVNGNRKILSSVYYAPLGNKVDDYTLQASSTKRYVIMMDGETLLLIADSESAQYLVPEETLENLEELYPGNEHVKGYGFYLSGTTFAEQTGYKGEIPEDVFIGLRKLRTDVSYGKKMQKYYPYSKDLLDSLVERFS